MKKNTALLIFIGCLSCSLSFAAPKIILKLDDLQANKGFCPCIPTLDYLLHAQVKAGFGAVAERFDSTSLEVLKVYLNATNKNGEKLFEIWHHGLDHSKSEFKATPYAFQKEHFEKADQLILKFLGIQMHSFGSPYNASDSTTNQVIKENPAYHVVMYASLVPGAKGQIKYLNNRVNIEKGTGNPQFDYFVENFNKNIDKYQDYMILQAHPNGWSAEKLDQFKKIVQFLLSRGCEFVLPYEYGNTLKSNNL